MDISSPTQVTPVQGSPVALNLSASGPDIVVVDVSTGILWISKSTVAGDWVEAEAKADSILDVAISDIPPATGQTLVATSSTSASWQNENPSQIRGITISATPPTAGQVLTATSPTAADWEDPAAAADATTSTKGIIKLAGNLGGTANSPSIVSLPAISGAALTNLTAANIASGTAGINISGNAATATNATTASSATTATTANNSTRVGGITVTGTPTAGQVLTATSPTAADWESISTGGSAPDSGQPSGVSSFSFSGLTTGVSYRINFRISQNSSNAYLALRFNGDTNGANYASAGTTSLGTTSDSGASPILLETGTNTAAGEFRIGWMEFSSNPVNSSITNLVCSMTCGVGGGTVLVSYTTGVRYSGSALSSISFHCVNVSGTPTGTMTGTATIRQL